MLAVVLTDAQSTVIANNPKTNLHYKGWSFHLPIVTEGICKVCEILKNNSISPHQLTRELPLKYKGSLCDKCNHFSENKRATNVTL